MASYLLHGPCYLDNHYRAAGETVEFDGPPNAQMEPLDADGWTAFHIYAAERQNRRQAPVSRFPFKVIEQGATAIASQVEIPADHASLKGLPLTNLARKLGAPRDMDASRAHAFIAAEAARRAAAKESR